MFYQTKHMVSGEQDEERVWTRAFWVVFKGYLTLSIVFSLRHGQEQPPSSSLSLLVLLAWLEKSVLIKELDREAAALRLYPS